MKTNKFVLISYWPNADKLIDDKAIRHSCQNEDSKHSFCGQEISVKWLFINKECFNINNVSCVKCKLRMKKFFEKSMNKEKGHDKKKR